MVEDLKKAIKKCLCPKEKPLDPTYVRLVILKTREFKNGYRIMDIAQHQELTSNRFSMWKFCILMHKILHEGHKQVLHDSFQYLQQFEIWAIFWSAQKTHHLAQCITQYCRVLQRKLTFHQTYRHIKGDFQYDYETDMDLNTTFQLCLDMCDYLEELLHLKNFIFMNLKTDKIISNSKKGLCRVTALITIMAECNLLYQHTVDVLRLLHSQLSADVISGLCVRFNNVIFIELQRFYEQVRLLQMPPNYFDIPVLPAASPLLTDQYNRTSTITTIHRNSYEPSAPLIDDLHDY